MLGRDSRPKVTDVKLDRVLLFFGAEDYASTFSRVLDGVLDKVGKDLLNCVTVNRNERLGNVLDDKFHPTFLGDLAKAGRAINDHCRSQSRRDRKLLLA